MFGPYLDMGKRIWCRLEFSYYIIPFDRIQTQHSFLPVQNIVAFSMTTTNWIDFFFSTRKSLEKIFLWPKKSTHAYELNEFHWLYDCGELVNVYLGI